MKNQLQKLTQKLADKISNKKYEQMIDPTVPTIKKSNANFCKKLFYNKLDQNEKNSPMNFTSAISGKQFYSSQVLR